MSKSTSTKKVIQNLALALFLIGLPLGSWYYLRAGFNYHKELMNELKDYGRIPDFTLVNQKGVTVSRSNIEGKTAILSFFNPNNESYGRTMEYFRKYYSQFHEREDLIYLAVALEPTTASQLEILARKEELNDIQHYFLAGDEPAVKKLINDGVQIPDLSNRADDMTIPLSSSMIDVPEEYPYLVLINESGMIRNYYDINNEQDLTRLIEHLALTLPRKSEEEAVLKREKEK
jgi:peroxiredoxin